MMKLNHQWAIMGVTHSLWSSGKFSVCIYILLQKESIWHGMWSWLALYIASYVVALYGYIRSWYEFD